MEKLKPVLMLLLGVICGIILFNVVKSIIGFVISVIVVVCAVYGLHKAVTYFRDKKSEE